jgi:hypothetical protein
MASRPPSGDRRGILPRLHRDRLLLTSAIDPGSRPVCQRGAVAAVNQHAIAGVEPPGPSAGRPLQKNRFLINSARLPIAPRFSLMRPAVASDIQITTCASRVALPPRFEADNRTPKRLVRHSSRSPSRDQSRQPLLLGYPFNPVGGGLFGGRAFGPGEGSETIW